MDLFQTLCLSAIASGFGLVITSVVSVARADWQREFTSRASCLSSAPMSIRRYFHPGCLMVTAAAALLAPAAGEDFSDVCHCMQSPENLIDVLDRQGVRHGLRNGPTAEMFPDLSDAECELLKEYWEQCDALRRYYANLQMQGAGTQKFVLRTAAGKLEERLRGLTFHYYAAGEKQLRLDLRWEEEGTGRSLDLIGVITPTSQEPVS